MEKLITTKSIVKSITFIVLLVSIIGCNKNTPLSPKENMMQILTDGIWDIESVNVDGTDFMSTHRGMTISFDRNSYNCQYGYPVWPETGAWDFMDEEGNIIVRGDGLEVHLFDVTSKKLHLSFLWDETIYTGGKTEGISGEYVFVFRKRFN